LENHREEKSRDETQARQDIECPMTNGAKKGGEGFHKNNERQSGLRRNIVFVGIEKFLSTDYTDYTDYFWNGQTEEKRNACVLSAKICG
jgi:hypothetical protein